MQLLIGVTGSQKISMPMIIVACGIAKMFVGELVETGNMSENFPMNLFILQQRFCIKKNSLAEYQNMICSSNCYGGKERIRTYKTLSYQGVLS